MKGRVTTRGKQNHDHGVVLHTRIVDRVCSVLTQQCCTCDSMRAKRFSVLLKYFHRQRFVSLWCAYSGSDPGTAQRFTVHAAGPGSGIV